MSIQEDYDITKSTRNKSVLKIEQRLTYLAENDPRNEEMYHLLKKLASIWIHQNKYTYGYSRIDEVIHDVAADTWMKVLNGTKIYAWIFYIGKMIKFSYIPNQKKLEHEVIDTTGRPDLEAGIINMCAGSAISNIKQFDEMLSEFMLDNIGPVISNVMKNTKYKEGTLEYMQIYTNVCINLVKDIDNEEHIKFRIDEGIANYVEIVIEQFKKEFRSLGFNDSIMKNVDTKLSTPLDRGDLKDPK